MTLQRADRVWETTTTTGTGTYALGGARTGYQAFSAVCSNNDTAEYVATNGVDWEVGLGTWTTGNNLARTTIYASSNANAVVSWGTGSKDVFLDIPAHYFNSLAATPPVTPQGRLTLTSNTPVMAADVNGATTIYYADYVGDYVPVYDGLSWTNYPIGGQISLALDDNSGNTGYQQSGFVFDLFAYVDSGTLYLCTGPAWTDATTRSAAIAMQNGIWTNAASMALKYDTSSGTFTAAANTATYLGSVFMPAATTTLSAAITTTGQTSMTVASATGSGPYPFPATGNFYILIDSEVMLVTAGQATTTWTITRGQRGTTAATHSNGAAVTMDHGQTVMQFKPVPVAGGTANMVFLYNAYNHVTFVSLEVDPGLWTDTTVNTNHQANSSLANAIWFLDGLQQNPLTTNFQIAGANNQAGGPYYIWINLDSTTALMGPIGAVTGSTATVADNRKMLITSNSFAPQLGIHYVSAMMLISGIGNAVTWGYGPSYGLTLSMAN